MNFEVKALPGGTGAEVVLDPAAPLDAETRKGLYDVWLDAAIVLFRGQGVDAERHLALSRCFGELEVHPVESIRLPGTPEIITLNNRGEDPMIHYYDGVPIANRIPWHTDMIYTTTPCRGAMLRMIENPAEGGETGWIDTAAAYDALPEETKQRIDGLEARFDFRADICDMRFARPPKLRHGDEGSVKFPDFPTVIHPLVWTHPESGRRSLNLSPVQLTDVVDLPLAEGDALLEELVAHVLSGRFTYVHTWAVNDLVLWDNWRTMHTAFGIPPECEREVQRTTLKGAWATGRLAESA